MLASLGELKSAALALPAVERADLAEFLLHSLDEPNDPTVRAEWLALAEQRLIELRQDKAVGVPAEVVLRNLLEARK